MGNGSGKSQQSSDNLTLRNNSLISAAANNNADGGNIKINSQFIIAFPSQPPGNSNDIVANAELGTGGNIDITADSLFGIQEGPAIPGNGTNDIDASSEFGLDGDISITTPDVDVFQGETELPNNIVEADSVASNVCSVDRGSGEGNSLVLKGKGGIPVEPIKPLTSNILLIEGEQTISKTSPVTTTQTQTISTSIGDIIPARGLIVKEDGSVILTPYLTAQTSSRLPSKNANCSEDRKSKNTQQTSIYF